MLIEFRVENHRSLRDEQALTLEAGRVGDDSDLRPRRVEGHRERLLTVAALYGANASGKSNVLSAMQFGRDAVVYSSRFWPPEGGVDREPFALGPGSDVPHLLRTSDRPSLCEWTLLLDDVRYEYGFAVDDEQVLEEWLYAWPHGRRQVWFERDGDAFEFGENLKGENRRIQEFTRANALFLSTAAQLRHEQLLPIFGWFARVSSIDGPRVRPTLVEPSVESLVREVFRAFSPQQSLFPDGPVRPQSLLPLLQAADVGIVDVRVDDDPAGTSRSGKSRGRILLRHQSAHGGAWLPLEQESHGTIKLLRMAPSLLDVLARGGLLLVDELERSLHPLLALQLVRQFNDPSTNPHNAQLVFTTHDTNLLGTTLGEPVLRRDQVWLVEKDQDGASHLWPLTDYKPRKEENLERGYLQGRYGAIPFLGPLSPPQE